MQSSGQVQRGPGKNSEILGKDLGGLSAEPSRVQKVPKNVVFIRFQRKLRRNFQALIPEKKSGEGRAFFGAKLGSEEDLVKLSQVPSKFGKKKVLSKVLEKIPEVWEKDHGEGQIQ